MHKIYKCYFYRVEVSTVSTFGRAIDKLIETESIQVGNNGQLEQTSIYPLLHHPLTNMAWQHRIMVKNIHNLCITKIFFGYS